MNSLATRIAEGDATGRALELMRQSFERAGAEDDDAKTAAHLHRQAARALHEALVGNRDVGVVPALVELAGLSVKARMVDEGHRLLLRVMAIVFGDPLALVFDASRESIPRSDRSNGGALQVLEESVDVLAPLANDDDASSDPADDGGACRLASSGNVARVARLLLRLVGADARRRLPDELRSRLEDEQKAWARSVALVWAEGPPVVDPQTLALDPGEPPLVRFAAIVRATSDAIARDVAPNPDVLAVVTAVTANRRKGWSVRWAPPGAFAELGDPQEIALLSPAARVHFGERSPGRVALVVRALRALLEAVPDVDRQRAALAGNLATFAFGLRAPRWLDDKDDEPIAPSPDEVSPAEREVLEAIARKVSSLEWDYDVHHNLFHLRLPATHRGLQRWLGVAPPGPLNMLVKVTDSGVPRELQIQLAVQRMLVARVEMSELARAIASTFAPANLVYAMGEAFDVFDAHLHCSGPMTDRERDAMLLDLRVAALRARGADPVVPAILERFDRLHDVSHNETTKSVVLLLLLFLSRLLDEGAFFAEDLDSFVASVATAFFLDEHHVREVLERVPQERRDRILVCAAQQVHVGNTRADFTDLATDAARARIREIVQRPPSPLAELGKSLFDSIKAMLPDADALDPL